MRILALLLLLFAQDLDKLIEQLDHDDIEVRAKAAAEFVKIGRPALDALRKAAASDRNELAGRARALIAEIDFPEPGAASNGLAIAIKAEKEYKVKEKVTLKGRVVNVGDRDITIEGLTAGNESDDWLLKFDGKADEYHLCFRPREPAPDVAAKLTIPKGQHVEFTFSPRAWCALIDHSKCGPFQFPAGDYTFSIALNLPNGTAWKGKAFSNSVLVAVKP